MLNVGRVMRIGWICLCVLALVACRSPDKGAGEIGPIKKWGQFAGDRVQSTPAIGTDGTIYVGSADKYLYALTPKGHVDWRYNAGGNVLSPTVTADGSIVFTTSDGKLVVVSHDGRRIWHKRPRDVMSGCPPAVTSNGYIFTSGKLVLVGYTLKDGKPKRLAKKMPPVMTCVVIANNDTIYFGSKTKLYAWGLDGKQKWVFDAKMGFKKPVFDADGNLYLGVGGNGKGAIISLDKDGKERWRHTAPSLSTKYVDKRLAKWWGFFFPPTVTKDGRLVAVRVGEGIVSISLKDKKRQWMFPHPDADRFPFHGQLTVANDGMAYAGAGDNYIYAITPKGKRHYRFLTQGRVFFGPALSPDQSTVYIGSEDKHLYALHAHKK
jgi:outer membrane protein assembly factor BamB